MAMSSYPAGVRLLPNAVTVLALCSGMSAVYFALGGRFELCVAAVGAAALCDALDGRLARLLDATTRIGAELDSLSDLVSFGVAPALVLYVWQLEGNRFGWTVALVFAVCMMLRLARFNTLIDVEDPYPFTKEFFVGVPAPAAALVAGLPLYVTLHLGPGWWSSPLLVGLWALLVAGLMVSRLPTLSFKTVRVRPQFIAPLLVLVGLGAAVLITAPFLGLAVVTTVYLLLIPYSWFHFRWLARHPEAWNVPVQERRAVARAARATRRLGLRPPLRRRVAGRASAVARAVRRFGDDANGVTHRHHVTGRAPGPAPLPSRSSRLRLGLRRVRRR
jgi:CDP-diacylglycerol--serine O-phosphatidyltransferase